VGCSILQSPWCSIFLIDHGKCLFYVNGFPLYGFFCLCVLPFLQFLLHTKLFSSMNYRALLVPSVVLYIHQWLSETCQVGKVDKSSLIETNHLSLAKSGMISIMISCPWVGRTSVESPSISLLTSYGCWECPLPNSKCRSCSAMWNWLSPTIHSSCNAFRWLKRHAWFAMSSLWQISCTFPSHASLSWQTQLMSGKPQWHYNILNHILL
jgi:hypothetical protein